LNEIEIDFLLMKFHSINTNKLIFIHEELNDEYILSNPSFTDILSIKKSPNHVELLQFNIEIKIVHVQEIMNPYSAITKDQLQNINLN
jgi:hypothetical protein